MALLGAFNLVRKVADAVQWETSLLSTDDLLS